MSVTHIDRSSIERDAQSLDVEAFIQKHNQLYLVIEILADNQQAGGGFKTTMIQYPTKGQLSEMHDDTNLEEWPRIIAIGTRESRDTTMLTVGRTRSSAITLAQPAISKLHAYFSRDPVDGTLSIADAGSTNGTTLNDKTLAPKEKSTLNGGDVVVFGGFYRAHFLPPRKMFAHLRSH